MSSESEDHLAASKVGKVNINGVKIDRSYQRVPSPQLVDRIADDWDVIGSELILVSDRGERPEGSEVDGGLYLVNGQHRSLAAKKLGIKQLDARIINLHDHPDPASVEAKYRLVLNVGLSDRATERFKAQIRSGNEESVAIVRILATCGTEIAFDPTADYGLKAVSTLETIYRADGFGNLLRETLELIQDSFGGYGGKAGSSAMLKGAAWFIVSHFEVIDRNRLVKKLSEVGAAALDRRARTFQGTLAGSLWFNYYRAMVDIWNDHLAEKQRLEWVSRGAKKLGATAYSSPDG